MTEIVLVRHGQAAAGWGDDADPGLSPLGRLQAEAIAESLAPLDWRSVVTSPLRRTQETAAPLAARWGVTPVIDETVAEIPSPSLDMAERSAWLTGVLGTPWDDWPEELQEWRRSVVASLSALPTSTVVVTHYVAITVAVGDQLFSPQNCSATRMRVEDGRLAVVELGTAGPTVVR